MKQQSEKSTCYFKLKEKENSWSVGLDRTEAQNLLTKGWKIFAQKGIVNSNRYNPEENGYSERSHQTRLSKIRCVLKDTDDSHMVAWSTDEHHTCDELHTMARLGNKTPSTVRYGKKTDASTLHMWGSSYCAHVPEKIRKDKKLSARAIKCVFLGISEHSKGYTLLNVSNNRFLKARDVLFDTEHLSNMIA